MSKVKMPAGAWHIPAALLAVLLTVTLWGTQLGLFGLRGLTSVSLHERVSLDRSAVDLQMKRIREGVDALGAEYGFSAEPVAEAVTREQVEALDRQVTAWWTGLFATGEMTDAPVFTADVQEILRADTAFMEGLNPLMVNNTLETIENRISETVRKTAVLFRDQLVNAGLQRVRGSVNLPQAMELLRQVPLVCGLASLLLAGLIALMMSRKIQTAGQYIGGALSGCGLLMLLTLFLMKTMNLRGMIGEASQALEAQYSHLARILSLEVMGAAAAAMILGGLLMAWAARTRRRAA